MLKINEAKLRRFISQHLDLKDGFQKHPEAIAQARRELGYSPLTSTQQIAHRLDKALASFSSATKIPDTNNAGQKRKMTVSFEDVIKRSHFTFHSNVVRECFPTDKGYTDFVRKYCEEAERRRNGANLWRPTLDQVAIFEKYDSGKLTIQEVQVIFGLKQLSKTMERIGKIYAYKKEVSRIKK